MFRCYETILYNANFMNENFETLILHNIAQWF